MRTKKPNVGIFIYDFFPFVGGQGKHLYQLYKQNMQEERVKMFIFSPHKNDLTNHIPLFLSTKKSKFKNIAYSIYLQNKIESLIREYHLDLVHIHGGPGGLFLLKRLSVPSIFTSHHTYWQQYHYVKGEHWKKIFYILEKISYQKVNKIISVSNDTRKVLIDRYGIDNKRITYIPNGIHTGESFSKKSESEQLSNILYVGRIDKRKGTDFLVKSMKPIHKKNPGIVLYIVGEGKDKKTLETYSKQNNLPIKFLGYLPDSDINELYKKISVQIVPSIFEGFGITVLEGMARGIPIIATEVDGIKSIIKNNSTGILVTYGDTNGLADAVINLVNDLPLQKKITTNAHRQLHHYNWKNVYIRTIKLYEELI
ncbi:MAG: glycosyltransferase family 4 protein [bacterium]|nr:glycosyltransferase family 4 protein [bacterium]